MSDINETRIKAEEFLVAPLSNARDTNLAVAEMIQRKTVDEVSALLIYALQPQLKLQINMPSGFQPDTVQIVVMFMLFHGYTRIWTGYCPIIPDKESFCFQVAPKKLADLAENRRNRDVAGKWKMVASVGIVDLVWFRQLTARRQATYMNKLDFTEVGSISWNVVAQPTPSKINRLGQFEKRIPDTGQTYSQDDI